MRLVLILLALFSLLEIESKEDEVKIEVLYKPAKCDIKSQMNDILTTDYIGTFPDGRKFDSTYDRNQSMTYFMGKGDVIKGCEIGTLGMCVGEKRRLIIPPSLAYAIGLMRYSKKFRHEDYGQIPAGSTLHFDIVLTDLQPDPFKAFETFKG